MSRRANIKAPDASPARRPDRWAVPGVCLFLAAIIWAVFGQTLHYQFVNYDDNLYVYENAQVVQGLTLNGMAQAFAHGSFDNWDPLTAISHMLDCQWYGLNPGGHHFTSVLLHTATAILLFLVLRRMTGALWRSAFVAAVFAIHPLRAESVAWVSERKDVLSGVFFMLTLLCYVKAVTRDKGQVTGTSIAPASFLSPVTCHPSLFYWLALVFFALGLMCKPMLVTLPCVLLLLDYWPLKRFTPVGGGGAPWRLLVEKVPLLALSGAACAATLFVETVGLPSFRQISLPVRVGNALISYVAYLGQMFWPSGLAPFYPITAGSVGVARVAPALAVLAVISAGVFVLGRRRPYLVTGWLWYLIMLVPVIGLIQVGAQARADRHTYLPQIGLYLLLTWAAADLCAGWRHRRVVLGGAAAIILTALIGCARAQTAYWRNSETLWTHALACTSGNWIAHDSLGLVLFQKGAVDEAITHYQKALQINPEFADAHISLGNALFGEGALDDAIFHYRKALQIEPDNAGIHNNLGTALLRMGEVDEALSHFQRALEIEPDNALARNNLGNALFQKGSVDEAIVQYQKALEIRPGYAEARFNLGNALRKQGNVEEAIVQYQKALKITPDHVRTLNNLAWVLATCPQASLRDGNQAVALAQRANQLTGGGNPVVLCTLAAAYAEAGRFPEAVATAQHALQVAGTQSNPALADDLRSKLKLYQALVITHIFLPFL